MSKKKTKRKFNPSDLVQSLIELFAFSPNKTFNIKQVVAEIGLDKIYRELIGLALDGLVMQGVLDTPEDYRYKLKHSETEHPMVSAAMLNDEEKEPSRDVPKSSKKETPRYIEDVYVVGIVDITKKGSAYITPEVTEGETVPFEDIFVSEHRLIPALHGDKVKVRIISQKGAKADGEVVEVLEHKPVKYVGRIEISGRFGFLIPDTRNMPYDLFIHESNLNGATQGQKVIAEIIQWEAGMKNPNGKVLEVLGNAGDNDTEMHAILAEYDLPYSFPTEVDKMASKISEKITKAEIKKRRDFRDITTFTIDPADAKDFDDALSIQQLPNGNWEVGVHIADVTHYVKLDGGIEKEAQERATSVYLVDRTIPMLPERLSNFICSLRPDEEKLCFSAVFEITPRAVVVNQWLGRTVIKSVRRYSYEEAQLVIDTKEGDFCTEILTLDNLAKQLRKKRFSAGAMGFERPEPKFDLDAEGKPLGVHFKIMKDSNQLIEEFMLLANRKVAEYVGKTTAKKARTFVYRIHNKPTDEKLHAFGQFIERFGYKLEVQENKNVAKDMNKILHDVKGKPEENLIETLAVRSMSKASYSTDNVGHYGLAFPHYTHFTSPIRRYPDMMVHRLLDLYLHEGKSADKAFYDNLCKHSSTMEMRAAEAERASIKYKMIEFMQDKIGMEFDGIVSGVTEWGIYVELTETKIEGMVSVRSMKDDFYDFDEKNYLIRGRSNGHEFALGGKVRVSVIKSDLQQRHLDFALVLPEVESTPRKKSSEEKPYKKKKRKS